MFKFLDRTFLNFLSGFVLILVISFSLLTFFGAYQQAKESVAALFEWTRAENIDAR